MGTFHTALTLSDERVRGPPTYSGPAAWRPEGGSIGRRGWLIEPGSDGAVVQPPPEPGSQGQPRGTEGGRERPRGPLPEPRPPAGRRPAKTRRLKSYTLRLGNSVRRATNPRVVPCTNDGERGHSCAAAARTPSRKEGRCSRRRGHRRRVPRSPSRAADRPRGALDRRRREGEYQGILTKRARVRRVFWAFAVGDSAAGPAPWMRAFTGGLDAQRGLGSQNHQFIGKLAR
jgi:hypothetical protein